MKKRIKEGTLGVLSQDGQQRAFPLFRGCEAGCNPYLSHNVPSERNFNTWGFPGTAVAENPPANAGDARDAGSTPGLGRSPGGRNGNPFQSSCLKNSIDRGV